MPIYDYICSSCHHRTEVIHGINDPGPRFCPNCGLENTLRKALSTPAIHFKGSGWAKKDRSSTSATRTKASASSTSGEGGADGGSGGGSASSSDDSGSSSTSTSTSTSKGTSSDGGKAAGKTSTAED